MYFVRSILYPITNDKMTAKRKSIQTRIWGGLQEQFELYIKFRNENESVILREALREYLDKRPLSKEFVRQNLG